MMSSKNSASKKPERILNFVLIGAKSSGKTMYLGTLFGEKIIQSNDSETTTYVSPIWKTINEKEPKIGERNCKVPPTKAGLQELYFSYQHEDFGRVQFSIDDYDGSFTETVSKWEHSVKKEENNNVSTQDAAEVSDYSATTEERKKLLSNVKNSEGCIFFLPYEKSTERFKDFAEEIDAFIKWAQFSSSSKSPIPASIVITKWDESEHFKAKDEQEALNAYIRSNEHFRRTYETIKKNFMYTQLIAVSSCKNYNLSRPLDFSMEKTFEHWYARAKQYKKENDYEKLIKYLSKRYIDIKFNEKHDFVALYDEAQEKYIGTVKEIFEKKETIKEKEQYLEDVSSYFITKKVLLVQHYEKLNTLKRAAALRKSINFAVVIAVIIAGIVGVIEYKNKLDVEEAYKVIVDKYKKGVVYQDMEKEIDQFLNKYKKVNFLYAFANVPGKRIEIYQIKNELYDKSQKTVEAKKENIMHDDNLTASEKKFRIKDIEKEALGMQKTEFLDLTKQLEFEEKTVDWIKKSEDCLKEENIEKIEEMLSSYYNDKNIVHSKKSNVLRDKLNKRKQQITHHLKIEEAASISDISKFLEKIVETNVEENDLNELIIKKVLSVGGDDLSTDRGQKLQKELKTKHTLADLKKFIDGDLKKFLDRKENFKKIEKKINDVQKYTDLKITYTGFNLFEENEQNKTKNTIKDKLDGFVNEILENMPMDDTETDEISALLNKLDEINGFKLKMGDQNYQYIMDDELKKRKDAIGAKNKILIELLRDGIDKIRVSLEGKENNSLQFACGSFSESEISIDGFNAILSYQNKESCSDNNVLTFRSRITLHNKSYDVTIIDHDAGEEWLGLPTNETVTSNLKFTIDELYKLYKGDKVKEPVDNKKLILTFQKSD